MKTTTPESTISVTSKISDTVAQISAYSLDGRQLLFTKGSDTEQAGITVYNYDGTSCSLNIPSGFSSLFSLPFFVGSTGTELNSDGRSFNADFLSGKLPATFTYSRDQGYFSPSTYTGSSLLLEYLPHNLYTNTIWATKTIPSNWNETMLQAAGVAQGQTFIYNGNGSITIKGLSGTRAFISHNTLTTTSSPGILSTSGFTGIPFTFSFKVEGVSSENEVNYPVMISDCITPNITGNIVGYKKNKTFITTSESTITRVSAGDVISCTCIPLTPSFIGRIGLGVNGNLNADKTITISQPQLNYGRATQTYNANSSTSSFYQAPRFEHDINTGGCTGLLLEGNGQNVAVFGVDGFSGNSDVSFIFYNSAKKNILNQDGAFENGFLTYGPDGQYGSAVGFTLTYQRTDGTAAYIDCRIGTLNNSYFRTTIGNQLTTGITYCGSFYYKCNKPLSTALGCIKIFKNSNTANEILLNPKYIKDVTGPNGFTRRLFSFSTEAGVTSYSIAWAYGNSMTTTTALTGGDEVIVSSVQLEPSYSSSITTSNIASTYIPAGGVTPTTRRSDTLTVSGITGDTNFNWNQTEGTLFLDMSVISEEVVSSYPSFLGFYTQSGATGAWRVRLSNINETTPRVISFTTPINVTTAITNTNVVRPVAPNRFKIAVKQINQGRGISLTVNNSAISADNNAVGSVMATPSKFLLQQDPSTDPSEYFGIILKNISYWPYAISDTKLQNITII